MIPSEDIPREWLPEWQHVYDTRLGILCGESKPTHDQHMIAFREATEHIEKITGKKIPK